MEYMEFSLRVIISLRSTQFEGPYGGRRISYLIYQLLCGVNHLHQAGIAHRVNLFYGKDTILCLFSKFFVQDFREPNVDYRG